MHMKKILLTQLFVLTLLFAAKAQVPSSSLGPQNQANHPRAYDTRQSFWTEINVQGSITKDRRWQYQMDLQYRRMSDANNIPGGNYSNIFKNPYQQVYRPWIHYWVVPGSIRLSLSPIGYWATWTAPDEGATFKNATANKAQTGVGTFQNEFRTCPQVTFVNNTGRFTFFTRLRYEFRWQAARTADKSNDAADIFDFNKSAWDFNTNTSTPYSAGAAGYGAGHKGRIRLQGRMQVLLTTKTMQKNTIYFNGWDELFIGVGRHVGYNQNLDQNRTVAMLGYKLPTEFPIRIEAGVTYQMVFNSGAAAQYTVTGPGTAGYTGTSGGAPIATNATKNNELNTAYTVYVIFDEFHTLFKRKTLEQTAKIRKTFDRQTKAELDAARILKNMDSNQD